MSTDQIMLVGSRALTCMYGPLFPIIPRAHAPVVSRDPRVTSATDQLASLSTNLVVRVKQSVQCVGASVTVCSDNYFPNKSNDACSAAMRAIANITAATCLYFHVEPYTQTLVDKANKFDLPPLNIGPATAYHRAQIRQARRSLECKHQRPLDSHTMIMMMMTMITSVPPLLETRSI